MNNWNAARNAKSLAFFSLTVFVGFFVVVLSASYSSISMTGSIHAAMFFFVLLTLWLAAYTMAIIDYTVLPPCVRNGALSINFIKAFAEHQGPPIIFERQSAIRHRERWRRFVLLLFIRDLCGVGIFALGAAHISGPGPRVLMFVLALFHLALVVVIWRFLASVNTEQLFPDRLPPEAEASGEDVSSLRVTTS